MVSRKNILGGNNCKKGQVKKIYIYILPIPISK